MQELEKILREIEAEFDRRIDIQLKIMAGLGDDVYRYGYGKSLEAYQQGKLFVEDIIRKHMNDGWISVDEPPKKDYIAVFAVDKHDYYFVAVYDKEHGYRTNDVGADVDNIVAYRLFNQYRPERSDNHDG